MTGNLLFLLFEVVRAVFFLESFNSARGVDVFLLTCVERVAGRADFRVDFFCSAAGLKSIAAAASNHDFAIFWMYIFFHIGLQITVNQLFYRIVNLISMIIFLLFSLEFCAVFAEKKGFLGLSGIDWSNKNAFCVHRAIKRIKAKKTLKTACVIFDDFQWVRLLKGGGKWS